MKTQRTPVWIFQFLLRVFGSLRLCVEFRFTVCLSPRVSAAAGMTGDAEAVRVHFRSRAKVIQRADAKPRLDARRRVAARISSPQTLVARAGVRALDFPREQGVEDEADIAVAREPRTIHLIRGLVAIADAVRDQPEMAALV